jgi:glycosyltransferase involved in cell wall biosynthesis
MKLLIITQKVDKEDPILGFFHNWIIELSKNFKKISVICLEKGKYDLPRNVEVFSLGKESKRSKIKYVKNFFNLILGLHREYDSVFVHMNQEYILLGGFIWKILRKKIYFWRNHKHGNLLTRIAVWLSNEIFYTSPDSFVARYRTKATRMPVGIDMDKFKFHEFTKKKNSILSLGRISPIKNIHIMLEAAIILEAKKVQFVFDVVGDPISSEDFEYKEKLIKENQNLIDKHILNFYPAVPNYETPKIYSEHEFFLNLTPSGSFDKTILESATCGCIPIILNKSLSSEIDGRMIIEKETPESVAEVINFWLSMNINDKTKVSEKLQNYVLENHSLDSLINKLTEKITN